MIAHNVIVTELIEKVSSLYSAALEVPMECEALPRAIPLPMGLCTRINLKIVGAAIAPKIPAIIQLTIVIEAFPPNPLATSIATGVVRDLGGDLGGASGQVRSYHQIIPK